MGKSTSSRLMILVGILTVAALAGPPAALASPPENDSFAAATPISTLPFTDSGDLNGTTTEPGEPQFCNFLTQSVWYAVTLPDTTAIEADLNGSAFGVGFSVYQAFGPGIGNLGFMGCIGFGGSMRFTANPGTTYYIQVGSVVAGPAQLQLNLQEVPPPANDDFADATIIGTLPFLDTVDITVATTEPGEPTVPTGAFTPITASAWYAFTPAATQSITASANSCCVTPILAVYTGSSLTDLTEVASRSGFGQAVTFQATAGTTYHVQLGTGFLFGGSALMSLRVEPTLPPVANFFFGPFDPSTFDTITFFDQSSDPGQVGFASWAWDFGDGTSATGCCPTHQYASDGDYTVRLTVTTVDGRTASVSRIVRVATHDVAITKLMVPNTAHAGQTKRITVGLVNGLYPENVQVQLFKSVPGGFGNFQLVGTLTQLVPVHPSNQTVPFYFSYTFTSDDAALGKVTFQAVATIIGARDAVTADNTAISFPTRVGP